jgi:spore coat polysaccharide biosynthesis predicted glycosyltransferase SpsG
LLLFYPHFRQFFRFQEKVFQKMENLDALNPSIPFNNPLKKAWIRTDGDRNIGFGHLLRCQAIANYLPTFTFLVSESSVPFVPNDIPYRLVEPDFSVQSALKLATFLAPGDLLIIDSYLATSEYVKTIRSLGFKTLQINDLPQDALPANVVLNHCPGLSMSDFSISPGTNYWLGLEYRLLRPDFQKPASINPHKKNPHLFLCFGGTDGGTLIHRALDWASNLSPDFRVSAVVANTQMHAYSLFPGLSLHANLNASQMKSIMADCSLAWVPASTLALECLLLGLPIITGLTADNQAFLHRGLLDFPAVASIGHWDAANSNELIRLSLSLVHQTTVDRNIPNQNLLSNQLLKLLA